MVLSFDGFAILFLLAPLLVAPLAPLIADAAGRGAGAILAIVPAGLFTALLLLAPGVAAGTNFEASLDWVPALGVGLAFRIDGLSLVFSLLITGIGALVLIYSGAYLDRHPHRGRFLTLLLLFMGAMLGLVLADNLVALFAFWEATSVASFLLIGFDHQRPAARRAALQALVVTGAGGLALLAGVVVLQLTGGTWQISALSRAEIGDAYPLVLVLVLTAAFTKSAQVPFHFWLPNAMEALTPVSAYLHSATMVQAGVYLLARLSPLLGGTPAWQLALCTFGGATLLWGGLMALKQTDLKQMLAQTTVASLGLSVLMLGVGGAAAAMAVAAYFVAHALYKAGLFLMAGLIDHGTGTRDLTALGGLARKMPLSFLAALLGGLSMFGVPPLIGYFAKEEIYLAMGGGSPAWLLLPVALVIGNGLVAGVGLSLAVRPFLGALRPTPHAAHEGDVLLWFGPVVLGLLGLAAGVGLLPLGVLLLAPMAAAIAGHEIHPHLSFLPDFGGPAIYLSILTWGLAGLVFWRLDDLRRQLDRVLGRLSWTWDQGFDQFMAGLLWLSSGWSRRIHHGGLERYLVVVFAGLAATLFFATVASGGWPRALPMPGLAVHEGAALALAAIGVVVVTFATTRLGAIVALGVQGAAVALIFVVFSAPDLAFTQLMVETLSVVIFALVMTRLHLSAHDRRVFADWARDGALAVLAAAAVVLVLMRVLEQPLETRLSEFYAANSVPVAHGHNIVNVILVDFRGLDTLGEIAVVMTAGIAALALLRRQHKRERRRETAA